MYDNKEYSPPPSSHPLLLPSITCYIILAVSVLIKFIPIIEGNWLTLGMGKLVLLASLVSIWLVYTKKFFACFFISLFASFFVVHEIIIFYDNYAIELGKELTSEGLFRSVVALFKDALQFKFGAFWATLGSVFSLIFVTIGWIVDNYHANYKPLASEENS